MGQNSSADWVPSAFHTWCFPFALICHWISIVFLLYGRRITTHSVDPPLTHFLGEFQAWDWLWYPMLWFHRRNSGAHGAENSIQISALAGVDLGPLASSGRGCCHYTIPHLSLYIYIYIYIQRRGLLICRAHSFPRPAEFRAEPRNLGFYRGIGPRNWATEFVFSPRNLTFFIRTTIFSQKMTSK